MVILGDYIVIFGDIVILVILGDYIVIFGDHIVI